MTGAWKDAATVCPTSMLRDSTVPSTGARMRVWSRLSCACARTGLVLADYGYGLIELVARHFDGFLCRIGGRPARRSRPPGRLDARDRLIVVGLGRIGVFLRSAAGFHHDFPAVVLDARQIHRALRLDQIGFLVGDVGLGAGQLACDLARVPAR